MASGAQVHIQGVRKHYGPVAALADLNLELGPGITGLPGPNGAGKTTLLRILATLLVEDVAAVCTRVVVLWRGRVRFAGTPTELGGLAGGRVWSSPEDGRGAVASWRTESGAYRVLGPRPSPAAEPLPPTVEDGYLLVCARARQDTAA
jgi:ABC-2 type transport system ATP-binding protein